MAFLTMQSLLIAAYALLLQQHFIYLLGISFAGIVTSISFFISGRTVSIEASVWRSYMRIIESAQYLSYSPWAYYYNIFPKRWKWRKNSKLTGHLENTMAPQDKLPGPTLWIFLPAVFLFVWFCAISLLFLVWWIVFLFLFFFIIPLCYYRKGIIISE